jgi:hypothetical protein
MMRMARLLFAKSILSVFIGIILLSAAPSVMAIPAFARKYKTACSTCHNNWPELNDFGRAFKMNGFKFPKDDDQFVKDPPLMLGAEAQKETFPYSIYPGELPILPIAFRYSGYLSYNSPQPAAVTAASGYAPSTTLFTPNTFTIISAGSFGPSIAFWIDNDISTNGSGAAGGLGDGYIKANNFLGYYLHVPQNDLNIKFGQFELDLPFTQARTINLTNYAVIAETANVGGLSGTTNNPLTLASPQTGVEIGGYPNKGNTWWSLAVVDGENAVYGTASPTTGHNSKDFYAHIAQRFNLERDPAVRKEVQAAGPTGVRDHTSLRFDGFGYYGQNELNQGGVLFTGLPVFHEPFYRAGGAFDYKFRSRFELWGLWEHGHDSNKALNGGGTALVSATPVTFTGGFLEAEYWAYPWLVGIMRYDGVNSPTDMQNGVSRHDTRSAFEPELEILVRPNIKLETQYTYNYEQPVPGASTFHRANQLLVGVDFVY